MPDNFSYRLCFYPRQWSSAYAGLWATSNASVGLSFNYSFPICERHLNGVQQTEKL